MRSPLRFRLIHGLSSFRIKPRRILAAICAALACALLVWTLTPATAGDPIVVAARDLPPGTELRKADLDVVEFPASLVPAKAFGSIAEVSGRTVSAGVSKGTPLTGSAVIDEQALPSDSTDLIMPVRLGEDSAAELLQPGQRIRLFSSLPEGGSEVIVDEVIIARIMDDSDGITAESGQLVSVILGPKDAEHIAEFAGLPISYAVLP